MGGSEKLVLNSFVEAFGPGLPARMAHGVLRVTLAALGLVAKHADAAELRVAVAAVLAVAADVVHVHNLARRNSLEAGCTREKKSGEERRNARNSVWQFGTGNRKCRRHARVHPDRES